MMMMQPSVVQQPSAFHNPPQSHSSLSTTMMGGVPMTTGSAHDNSSGWASSNSQVSPQSYSSHSQKGGNQSNSSSEFEVQATPLGQRPKGNEDDTLLEERKSEIEESASIPDEIDI